MGNQNNSIHINGKRYDARTGEVYSDAPVVHTPSKSIDGFMGTVTTQDYPVLAKSKFVQPIPIIRAPVVNDFVRTPAKHAAKHPTQKSQTLVRHAVAKPTASLKRTVKAQSHASAIIKQPTVTVEPKQLATAVDHRRATTATTVQKSTSVQKFAPTPAHHKPAVSHSPLPATVSFTKERAAAPHKARTTSDMLQQALEHATSHEQTFTPTHTKARGGFTKIAVTSVAVLALIGFAGMQSITPIKLHMASSKAGFSVASPGYKPAGFSLKQVSSDAGNAGLTYKSNSDQRAFSIIEKTSQWDSSTLRDSVLAPSDQKYQTIESAGRTIFVGEDHSANWVNGGIWYQVKNTDALSDHQIIKIANSL